MTSDEASRAAGLVREARSLFVLTGAGVSAESGVPTFRGDGGLWKEHRPEDLATPGAFRRDPRLVWEWYGWRRTRVARAAPNPGHRALARLALLRPGVTLVTQNVDALHEEALHEEALHEEAHREVAERGEVPDELRPIHLHGSLFRTRCTGCARGSSHSEAVDASSEASLPRCHACGELLRPDVVWFGESLPPAVLERSFEAAGRAEVALVVGTSAAVQPAASLPLATLEAGGDLIEVNPDPTPLSGRASVRLRGPAGTVLPDLVERVLEGR